MSYVLFTDGAARGNPGPAAYGVVLKDSRGTTVEERGRTIGVATNNEAEYGGLLAGLDLALEHRAEELEVRMDSDLLVSQLNGVYRVKAANLKPLYEQARSKLARFRRIRFIHIPRALNARADELANLALDSHKPRG